MCVGTRVCVYADGCRECLLLLVCLLLCLDDGKSQKGWEDKWGKEGMLLLLVLMAVVVVVPVFTYSVGIES